MTVHDDVSSGLLQSDRPREWTVVFVHNHTGESLEVRVRARSEADAYHAARDELVRVTFTLDSIRD